MNWTWGTRDLIFGMTEASLLLVEFEFHTWITSSRSRTETEMPVTSSSAAVASTNCSPMQASTSSFHTVAWIRTVKWDRFWSTYSVNFGNLELPISTVDVFGIFPNRSSRASHQVIWVSTGNSRRRRDIVVHAPKALKMLLTLARKLTN